jgi:protein-S-isoprenylcysteine O-methyltransferase Ste14
LAAYREAAEVYGEILTLLNAAAVLIVAFCWPVYLRLFFHRPKSASPERKTDRMSVFGIVLQAAGVALVFWPRQLFSPMIPIFPANIVVPVMAVLLALSSVWFSRSALESLGSQWSMMAEINGGHRLVREGLYRVVRHPLYLCFFGLVVATGMVWACLVSVVAAVFVFWIGVWIRVHCEENLLRQKFGSEFDDYVRNVPAIFPISVKKNRSSRRG